MSALDVVPCGASLLLLMVAGWAFLKRSIYPDTEEGNPGVQLLFAAVFALSANLLELLLCEILGLLDPRCGVPIPVGPRQAAQPKAEAVVDPPV